MDGSESLKFSIITASYNRKEFIESCICSVLGQTFPDIEYIIVDGGSTDGTLDIIKKYEDRISKLVSEPDNGIYDGLNKGIRMATGDVIGFLHADDLYATDNVLKTVAECFARQNVDSCYGDLLYVDKGNTDKVIRHWESQPYYDGLMKKGWMPAHPTFFVKKEIYAKYGSFNTDFKIAADYELMLRFLHKHRISTYYIPEVLIKMRLGGASNKSLSSIIRKSSEDYRAMKMHQVGGISTLLRKNLSKIPQFFKNSNQ